MPISRSVLVVVCALSLISFHPRIAVSINVASSCQPPTTIGFHTAVCTPDGNLALPLAFASLEDSLLKAVSWYHTSPLDERGFPPVVHSTFVDGNFKSTGLTIDAAMQDGLGLLSYTKLFLRTNSSLHLSFAQHFATYLIQATLTANYSSTGAWPLVPRSTGIRLHFPLDCASSYDLLFGCHTIEPDKVAIAAYALFRYHQLTGDKAALDVALHSAAVLAAAQGDGNSTHAPWPFRINAADGSAVNGYKNGNSAYPLRLFTALLQAGFQQFEDNLARLWAWVLDVQLQSLNVSNHSSHDYGNQFVNFHEDMEAGDDANRNSWTALELARFLIECRASGVVPDWSDRVLQLMEYSLHLFSHVAVGNTTIMGEQDRDHKAWGGANSKLAAVSLLLACAGERRHEQMGANNARWMAYFVDPVDGCPAAASFTVNATVERGGWQQDAHTDVVHNLVDALNAVDGVC